MAPQIQQPDCPVVKGGERKKKKNLAKSIFDPAATPGSEDSAISESSPSRVACTTLLAAGEAKFPGAFKMSASVCPCGATDTQKPECQRMTHTPDVHDHALWIYFQQSHIQPSAQGIHCGYWVLDIVPLPRIHLWYIQPVHSGASPGMLVEGYPLRRRVPGPWALCIVLKDTPTPYCPPLFLRAVPDTVRGKITTPPPLHILAGRTDAGAQERGGKKLAVMMIGSSPESGARTTTSGNLQRMTGTEQWCLYLRRRAAYDDGAHATSSEAECHRGVSNSSSVGFVKIEIGNQVRHSMMKAYKHIGSSPGQDEGGRIILRVIGSPGTEWDDHNYECVIWYNIGSECEVVETTPIQVVLDVDRIRPACLVVDEEESRDHGDSEQWGALAARGEALKHIVIGRWRPKKRDRAQAGQTGRSPEKARSVSFQIVWPTASFGTYDRDGASGWYQSRDVRRDGNVRGEQDEGETTALFFYPDSSQILTGQREVVSIEYCIQRSEGGRRTAAYKAALEDHRGKAPVLLTTDDRILNGRVRFSFNDYDETQPEKARWCLFKSVGAGPVIVKTLDVPMSMAGRWRKGKEKIPEESIASIVIGGVCGKRIEGAALLKAAAWRDVIEGSLRKALVLWKGIGISRADLEASAISGQRVDNGDGAMAIWDESKLSQLKRAERHCWQCPRVVGRRARGRQERGRRKNVESKSKPRFDEKAQPVKASRAVKDCQLSGISLSSLFLY
ncbi:hypothetical protein C8F01DRAFT_1094748 [Mycena amicta]|nr:hypothetical protein C8F01DRAFT_1094748 [Mycena amicta]